MKATTKSERSTSISEENAAAENQESSSSFRSLLNEMGEYQRESLSKILDTTVDGSCLPSCEHGFEEQLDVLMHCRQPLSFLQFFEHDQGIYQGEECGVGAYVSPRSCEYCGASTTTLCPASCQRPKLYFLKQKPPFASPEGWDAVTEYELPRIQEPLPSPQPATRSSSWVSGLFGGQMST